MDFIDVIGASGTAYRFRRWPGAGKHSPTAGNYILVADRGRRILAVGVLEDLSRADQQLALPKGAVLFTRLNIARQVREAEHLDLTAGHPEAARDTNGEPHLA